MKKVDIILSVLELLTIFIVGIAGLLNLDAETLMSIITFGIIILSVVIIGFIISYLKEVK